MKNTFSFYHEYGARNDPKIQDILFAVGAAGGWAWWVIVEMLYEQGGYLPRGEKSYRQLAYSAHCSKEVIEYVVEKSGLFKMDKNRFWSEKILFQLEERENKSRAARLSASAKWDKWKKSHYQENEEDFLGAKNTIVEQTQSERYANAEQTQSERYAKKEIKEKEKENNNIKSDSKSDEEEAALFNPENKPEITPKNPEQYNLPKPADKAENTGEKPAKKVNYDAVRDFWNDKMAHIPEIPKVARLTDVRKAKIEVRFKEFTEIGENPWSVYGTILDKIANSRFARGDNDRGWKIDFGWVFENERNWVKIYEGKYDNRQSSYSAGGSRPTAGSDTRNNFDEIWQ